MARYTVLRGSAAATARSLKLGKPLGSRVMCGVRVETSVVPFIEDENSKALSRGHRAKSRKAKRTHNTTGPSIFLYKNPVLEAAAADIQKISGLRKQLEAANKLLRRYRRVGARFITEKYSAVDINALRDLLAEDLVTNN